ncbi:MAG TPA: ATP-binding protein [Candidatus Binatia bacterium]|nr:ATP-binding protein [Candidatus Binatia bacterium]
MKAAAPDASLAQHLERITGYMRGLGLEQIPPGDAELRRELAGAIVRHTPRALDRWFRDIGPTLGIPEERWPQIRADMTAAMERWARHVADPTDTDTWVFLSRHARRGFIAQFPASRFLAVQMRFTQLLAEELRREYAHDRDRGETLLQLLSQEFQRRVLHITDFFVQGREEDLLEQEASFRRAFDRSPACIFMVRADDGTVFDANHVAERLLGYSRSELDGRRFHELHPPAEQRRAEALWRTAIERGHASRDDLHLLTRRGEAIPVFTNAGFIEYGPRRWVQLISVDISDRKRLETQLIQSEKMAAIGQLAAGIAHELRNPLAIVMNALYDLRQIVDAGNGEVAEDLRIAEEEIGRAQAIIKNLLEFSRESGADLEQLDVNDLIVRTLQLMQKYLQGNGVRVTTELGSIAPCLANVNAMRQILLNLITNAVQAMPDGGELAVRTIDAGPNLIRLEVRDTGIGIPPEHLQDIFNPFYTTKAPGQGTGLGLSVVHSILRRYRGEIRVASEVGRGTTFTIDLPCQCHADLPPVPAAG